jgi:hypothetical protein
LNEGNLTGVRREASGYSRKKGRAYVKEKIIELETSRKLRLIRGIN